MSNGSSRKSWWLDFSANQIATLILAVVAFVVTSYLAYLNYAKDINQERVKIEAEYAGRFKNLAEINENLNAAIVERDDFIKKQTEELDKQKSTQPVGPRPSTLPAIDIEKYLTFNPAPPEPKSWTEQISAFIAEYWKFLLVLVVILVAGALCKKK
jgi:hypothetical protein